MKEEYASKLDKLTKVHIEEMQERKRKADDKLVKLMSEVKEDKDKEIKSLEMKNIDQEGEMRRLSSDLQKRDSSLQESMENCEALRCQLVSLAAETKAEIEGHKRKITELQEQVKFRDGEIDKKVTFIRKTEIALERQNQNVKSLQITIKELKNNVANVDNSLTVKKEEIERLNSDIGD